MSSSGGEDQYCATGFPMGCYVDKDGKQKDACVISRDYSKPDTFYIFNHVDITIYYHPKEGEDWGKYLATDDAGGRIVCKFLIISVKIRFHEKKSLIFQPSNWCHVQLIIRMCPQKRVIAAPLFNRRSPWQFRHMLTANKALHILIP